MKRQGSPHHQHNRRHRGLRRRRSGAVMVEAILSIPVLLIAMLAVIVFGWVALIEHAVNTAAIEGARIGAKLEGTDDEVLEVISEIVGIYELQTSDTNPAGAGQGNVYTRIDRGSETETYGNSDIAGMPVGPTPSDSQVRVTVCVRITDVVPDLLETFGFSLVGRTIEVSSVANNE
jgi:Flp pilus assembly protein TadG